MFKNICKYIVIVVLVLLFVVALVEIKISLYGRETTEVPGPITGLDTPEIEEVENDIVVEEEVVEQVEIEVPKELKPEDIVIDYSLFENSIFIGNSRTQGLFRYSDLSAKEYTYQGLTVDTIHTERVINQNGSKVTIADAIRLSPNFETAYIMMGTNELGWKVRRIFIERYEKIIDLVLEANPECTIYVQSILPVAERISLNDKVFNMPTINEFNSLIKDMCERKGVIYVDITSALVNENGYLPDEASNDGIHLNKLYCRIWLKYLSENYTSKED